jgi:hypothetical protein
MTTEFDQELKDRLSRLEQGLVLDSPSSMTRSRGRLPWTASVLAIVASLSVAAGAFGAVAVQSVVRASPGIFAPGGPFYCTEIGNMSPADAQPLLAKLGYAVTWQIEDRDTGSSIQSATPPSDGYVVEGVQHGHALVIVVERGAGVQPVDHSCP